MYIQSVKLILLIILLVTISNYKVLGKDNINQAYFFINESNCPDCRLPKIKSLNNDIKLLIPGIITNIVYFNFDNVHGKVDQTKFNFVDNVIKGIEAEILVQFYGVKKNDSKLVIRFNDSLQKTLFCDNIFELNYDTFSKLLKSQMGDQEYYMQSSDLNNHNVGNIILKDRSNGDSTIIYDYNSNVTFLYNHKENQIQKKIELPDSIKYVFFNRLNTIKMDSVLDGPKCYELINIVDLKENIITYNALFLRDFRIDTTFEMYNNKLERVLTYRHDYIKVLLHYDLKSDIIKFDTLPNKLAEIENLYEIYSSNNLYNFSTYLLKDTNINNLSNQINMFGIYDPKFDQLIYLNTKSVFHLLEKPFLKKSIFNSDYNHYDSSYIIFNLRNKLLFTFSLNNEIINLNIASALNYILSDDSLKTNYYLSTKYKYDNNDLINISADNQYIYIILSYRDIVTHKMQIILQKYKLNGNIFSEEVLKLSNDDVLNFQFIQNKDKVIKALVNTSDNGWQILKYQN